MGGIPEPDDCIGLRTLLALDDVELHVIALFQSFVPIQLDCRVVDEYVWPVFTPDESVAFGVVEPLDLTFVLSHRLPPSLHVRGDGERKVHSEVVSTGNRSLLMLMTRKEVERLIAFRGQTSTT